MTGDSKPKQPPLTPEMLRAVTLGVVQDAPTARTLGHDGVVVLLNQASAPQEITGERFQADNVTHPTGSKTTPAVSGKSSAHIKT